MNDFFRRLKERGDATGARLVLGLDIDFDLLPERFREQGEKIGVYNYATTFVLRTHPLARAYKLHPAFLSDEMMAKIIAYIRKVAPDVLIILDGKYGDVRNSNRLFADKAFRILGVDAVTTQHKPGMADMQPFLDWKNKGVFVLCRMSGEGAEEFQDPCVLLTKKEIEDWGLDRRAAIPDYVRVAYRVSRVWNTHENCALVMGAARVGTSHPEAIKVVRGIVGNAMWFLCPGGVSQGGSLRETVRQGATVSDSGVLVNLSRAVLFDRNRDPLDVAYEKVAGYTNLFNQSMQDRFSETLEPA